MTSCWAKLRFFEDFVTRIIYGDKVLALHIGSKLECWASLVHLINPSRFSPTFECCLNVMTVIWTYFLSVIPHTLLIQWSMSFKNKSCLIWHLLAFVVPTTKEPTELLQRFNSLFLVSWGYSWETLERRSKTQKQKRKAQSNQTNHGQLATFC